MKQLNIINLSARAKRAEDFLIARCRYLLGAGGMKPKVTPNTLTKCDCSGFAAIILGLSRWQGDKDKPWSDTIEWIETSAIVRDAKGRRQLFTTIPKPVRGCLIVYGDKGLKQGHVGIVVNETFAVDCASNRGDKAIQHRPIKFWVDRGGIFVVLNEDFIEIPGE